MSIRSAYTLRLLFIISLLLASSLHTSRAFADECPAGTSPATAADVPVMNAAGVPGGVGTCWNKSDTVVGGDVGHAKQDLSQMWCGGRASTCSLNGTTYTSSIEGLDPKFSLCADKFMKQLRQQDSSACIRSAFRSADHQVCACGGNANGIPGTCAAAGKSFHQKGLAIDVNTKVSSQQLWNVAGQSGLGNPTGLHSSDPSHIQPIGGTMTNCSGTGFMPTDSDSLESQPAASASPSSGLSNYVRNLLGQGQMNRMQCITSIEPLQIAPPGTVPESECLNNGQGGQPQLPPPPPPPPPPQQSQPQPQQQPSSQSGQPTQSGSPQTPVSSQISTTPPPVSGSINTGATPSGNNPTSTSDLIDQYANPVSGSIDIATIVPIALNDSTFSSRTHLQDTSTSTRTASGTIAINQNYIPSQTFTSGDLANNPVWGVVPQQNGFLSRLLATFRDVLLYALNYLKPFGGNVPTQPSYTGNLE